MSHEDAMRVIAHNEEEFEVLKRWKYGDVTVLEVDYPNCPMRTKIMVFQGNAPSENATAIHPHFGQQNSPCARFDPKQDGWNKATAFALENATKQRDVDALGEVITPERVCRVLEAITALEAKPLEKKFEDLVYCYTHLASEKICSHPQWAADFLATEKAVLEAMEAPSKRGK